MPNGSDYGKNVSPANSGFGHMDRFGPSNSALAQFLYPFAFRDVVFHFDDFHHVATLSDWWTLGTDACSTAFAHAAGIGGTISGATQAAANDYVAILTSADWEGDKNAGQEWRWQTDVVTDTEWAQGFTDPLTDDTLTGINDIDTPTFTAGLADAAMFGLDTAQTLATAAFLTDGSTACMNATGTTLSGSYTGTACAYRSTRVQLTGNASMGVVFDACGNLAACVVQHGEATACQIEGGVDLTSRLVVGTLACAAITTIADYAAIWQDRV